MQIYPQDKKWYILYMSDSQPNNFKKAVDKLLKINYKSLYIYLLACV